jgi:hypothetical protein
MTPFPCKTQIEVEAKFLGDEAEFVQIVQCLYEQGFSGSKKPPVHRLHVYFDDGSKLREVGCRLRCVIASGEWCRYDFKADDPTGQGETTEVSLEKTNPIPLAEVINSLAALLPEGTPKVRLLAMREDAGIILVMTGRHEKAVLLREDLEVEVSWDVLTPLKSGIPLSEIEIELLSNARPAFDKCISSLETSLNLQRSFATKLDRAMMTLQKMM